MPTTDVVAQRTTVNIPFEAGWHERHVAAISGHFIQMYLIYIPNENQSALIPDSIDNGPIVFYAYYLIILQREKLQARQTNSIILVRNSLRPACAI